MIRLALATLAGILAYAALNHDPQATQACLALYRAATCAHMLNR
jgi:hypothetical protein